MSPSRFSHANGTCGPYKPVPPPKPFASSQVSSPHMSQRSQQMHHHTYSDDNSHSTKHNGHAPAYSHVLVTEQGQFVTHSSKFPIDDDTEKLVKMYHEVNSLVKQGLDNPSLITESPHRYGDQDPVTEITPNHYAQMRPYDPSKHPQMIPNGHQPNFLRPSMPTASYHPEASWHHRNNQNSVRFSIPTVSQSQEVKRTYPNGISYHPGHAQDRTPVYQASSQLQNGNVTREGGVYDANRSFSNHQDTNAIPSSQTYFNGNAAFCQANGDTNNGYNYRNNPLICNGDLNRDKTSTVYPVPNGHTTYEETNCDDESKREDKWGSLKRAGKKCSSFKNIISTKFTKSEPRLNSTGTNTQDIVDKSNKNPESESKTSAIDSEVHHNGENHNQESMNFQRAVAYSSLKAKLDASAHQTYNSVYSPPANQMQSTSNSCNSKNSANFSTNNQTSIREKQNGFSFPKRTGSCSHLVASTTIKPSQQTQQQPSWGILRRSDDNLTRPLASDQSYPDYSKSHSKEGVTVRFQSPVEERTSGGSDSGRGTGGGSANEHKGHDTSLESGSSNRVPLQGHSSGNESEWIDISESIEHPSTYSKPICSRVKYPDGSKTPPLPPLSPEHSPTLKKRTHSQPKKHSSSFSTKTQKKPDIVETTENKVSKPSSQPQNPENTCLRNHQISNPSTSKQMYDEGRTSKGNQAKDVFPTQSRLNKDSTRDCQSDWRQFDKRNHFEIEEMTSTEGTLDDLHSVLDEATEATSDDDLGSTRDGDTYLIRRQLEGLEGMYSEVLKALGGRPRPLRQTDPRLTRRRNRGSISSLPSSIVSSRPPRDRRSSKIIDDRLRRPIKDVPKNTNKRFQRLESHVVTLARSVAHLSSEMRTQQLMIQDIESIRNELSSLKISVKGPSGTPSRGGPLRGSRLWNGIGSTPGKVKKLTQFFGDEPPLVRIFLRRLGYEKYANIFEQEKIGMLELPYMTEERLQKIGIPLGPRLRILEESQGPITTDGNLSVYVV